MDMNSEMKADRMQDINKLEGLLAYAVAHNDEPEIERLRNELKQIEEGL